MLWLLPITSFCAAALLLMFGHDRPGRLASGAVAAMLMGVTLTAMAVAGSWEGTWTFSPALELSARLVPISAAVALLVPAVALPVVLFAAVHEPRAGLTRQVGLLVLFVGAMQLLVIADDLLTLLIGWELVGACSWALIAHDWRNSTTLHDAGWAFLATRFGDLGLFLAAMAAFAATGSLAFADLGRLEGMPLQLLTFGVLLSAAAKSAQLPFSFWLFNAMSGPSPASALLHAATMVAAGAYLLARLHPVLDTVAWFAPVVLALGLATALAGGVVAVLQPEAKKLLAASTSAHYGLMFVALGAGYPGVAIVHLVVHAWFKSLLFLGAGVASAVSGRHHMHNMALGRSLPVTAALVGSAGLALAGIPPLGGAWSKDLVGAAAGNAGHWWAWGVFLAGGLSACYAMRWQWLVFGPGATAASGAQPKGLTLLALALPALVTLALSLLWLPSIHEVAAHWLQTPLPSPPAWQLMASILLAASGLYAGWWLAREHPGLGRSGMAARLAGWLGLPGLAHAAVARPAHTLARMTARFDDRVVDRLPQILAGTAQALAGQTTRCDHGVVDRLPQLAARLGAWLAQAGSRVIETITDGIVEGTAWLVGITGTQSRRLESGLAHHYLVWVATGAMLMILLLLLEI